MRQSILDKFYQPTLFFFLLPVFQILLGMIFSLQYQSVNVLAFIFLYLFVLFNQMLENILLRIPNTDFEFSKAFFFTIQFLNYLTILYFGLQFSWMTSLVLFLFSLNIQGQFLFSYYNMELFAVLVSTVLKILFLNSLSFYLGTGFIQLRGILFFSGLLIPFIIYEISRVLPEIKKKMLTILVAASYVVSILLLWGPLKFASLLLLLTMPFAWGLTKNEFNRRTTSVFMVNFSLFYILLTLYGVLIA